MNFYHQDYFIKETSNSDLQYNIGYYEPNIYNINSNYKGTLKQDYFINLDGNIIKFHI